MLARDNGVVAIHCNFIQCFDMTFKPPLTTAELRDIRIRQDPADINRLLWGIKRLRAVVLHADQVQRQFPSVAGLSGQILECLRNDLKIEPCVLEEDERRRATPPR